MNDIIKVAKRLLEGATLGPWEWEERKYRGNSDCHHDWLGSEHGTALVTFDSEEYSSWVESTDSDKALIAAAPELAQALAEETWEYAVEEKWLTPRGAVWRLANGAQWCSSYRAAEESADPECHTRIVRRRVSPPEVINE